MPSLRSDLRTLDPYVSPQMPARVRLNTNESPYPPPRSVTDALVEEIGKARLNRYPDRDAASLVSALGARWRWPGEGVWVANGSNEVFMHLFLAFGGPDRTALTFEPTYSLHSLVPRLAMTSVAHLERGGDLEIDVDAALEWIGAHGPDVVIVCSPNNPTGGCTPPAAIERLVGECPGLVVVDEAYGEFADPSDSVIPLLREHDNLVVVRTFSKAWRLAG
ncbi:MAG: aminotransferase class I/II-fold pyridoxal phosphate-dependent enzyme, partial [Actinomycetota bacterium]|nr:aminotransferase class I/II-fold pyridoxal phosphate-dependent enzyme [Actinomycetota bacterium]